MCVGERDGGEIDKKDEKTRSKQNVVKGKKIAAFSRLSGFLLAETLKLNLPWPKTVDMEHMNIT